jgi:hypothetical protein
MRLPRPFVRYIIDHPPVPVTTFLPIVPPRDNAHFVRGGTRAPVRCRE